MTLINSSLLIGLVLAALPVVLHLVMRARPKRIEFPALRLLKARQASNARRMQLRQWLLMLLRILVISILVLAIARPSLPAANYGLRWWDWLILGSIAGLAIGGYQWISRRAPASQVTQSARDQRARRRLWFLLGGMLATLLFVALPWGMRIRAELSAPRNDITENIPVAAVFIFDNSLSMNYRHDSRTRLQDAVQLATDHLTRLPAGSRAAIASLNREDEVIFQADLPGAQSSLETILPTAVPDSLNHAVKAAVQAQILDRERVQQEGGVEGESDLFLREIYILTDLSEAAWNTPDEHGLHDLLSEHDWLRIYLIDVSVPNPLNQSLTEMRLSNQTVVSGRSLEVTVTASATAAAEPKATIEAYLVESDGTETRVGAPRTVALQTDATEISVEVPITTAGKYVEGFVRLAGVDPLADDNVRWFSLNVATRPRVLLVADRKEQSEYLRNALQPPIAEQVGQTSLCECNSTTTSQLSKLSLSDYDVVCVVNCARPDGSFWSNLNSFVHSGGGLFVVAGAEAINPTAWNTADSRELLPAIPIGPVRYLTEAARLQLAPESHSLVTAFRNFEEARTNLSSVSFVQAIAVEELPAETRVLMNFTGPGNRPALMERSVGSGRTLMFTSAIDNLPGEGSDWNNLVIEWSFLVLGEEIIQSLTGFSEQVNNFTVGQPIELTVPTSQRFEVYRLRRPGLRQTGGQLAPTEASVLITDADVPGNYLLKPFESESPFLAAFATNMRDQESNLRAIAPETLTQILGKDRFAIVHNLEELDRAVQLGRLGIEVFPLFMGLLVLLFCAEHLMANFFYDAEPPRAAATGPS